MIITIDGHAGSGKSTAARLLAAELGFELMNTGAMYRATAFILGRHGIDISTEPRNISAITTIVATFHFDLSPSRIRLNGEDLTDSIYTEPMGRAASQVGKFPEVRAKLKDEQRRIAANHDMICEGRDQGTAVFPDAPVKFFFTAAAQTRALRRAEQDGLDPRLDPTGFAKLVELIVARDHQDENRSIDPLRRAPDAVEVDTSILSLDEVVHRMTQVVNRWRTR